MFQGVAQALTASPRLSPLLLPHLETAIQDASPNTQSQAAGILRLLQERVGWGVSLELAGKSESMTQRWAETLLVALVGMCEIGGISVEHAGVASGGNVGGNVGGKLCGAGGVSLGGDSAEQGDGGVGAIAGFPAERALGGNFADDDAVSRAFRAFQGEDGGDVGGNARAGNLVGVGGKSDAETAVPRFLRRCCCDATRGAFHRSTITCARRFIT